MKKRISISQVDGKDALCFDTGLDSRSFAQAKMAKCLTEAGIIVKLDGTIEPWKASGIMEEDGYMKFWGPPFAGERINLLNENLRSKNPDIILQAVIYWIRAILLAGETLYEPSTAFVAGFSDSTNIEYPKGSVFFAPHTLLSRTLLAEGGRPNRYLCTDLEGIKSAAFTAGVFLYNLFSKNHPFPAVDFVQDMREGNFIPLHLAAPGLDVGLCRLVQSALFLAVPGKKK